MWPGAGAARCRRGPVPARPDAGAARCRAMLGLCGEGTSRRYSRRVLPGYSEGTIEVPRRSPETLQVQRLNAERLRRRKARPSVWLPRRGG